MAELSDELEEVLLDDVQAEKIYAWRLSVALSMVDADGAGYRVPDAERIAASTIDLHELSALLERGCSCETALAILE